MLHGTKSLLCPWIENTLSFFPLGCIDSNGDLQKMSISCGQGICEHSAHGDRAQAGLGLKGEEISRVKAYTPERWPWTDWVERPPESFSARQLRGPR